MEGLAVKSTDSIVHIVCATWRQMPVCGCVQGPVQPGKGLGNMRDCRLKSTLHESRAQNTGAPVSGGLTH